MKMNLPNKLTILRVILIIPFVAVMLACKGEGAGKWIALAIFIVASLTDMLDGKIARKYNLITDFGKFMDPLADKLLVVSAMLLLVDLKRLPVLACIIIIAREFIISGFRLVASDNGVVIAAGPLGKIKTVLQMIMVILMLADLPAPYPPVLTTVVMYLAVTMTVVSLIDYLARNWGVLFMDK